MGGGNAFIKHDLSFFFNLHLILFCRRVFKVSLCLWLNLPRLSFDCHKFAALVIVVLSVSGILFFSGKIDLNIVYKREKNIYCI